MTVEVLAVPALELDADRRIVATNRALERLVGTDEGALVGVDLFVALRPRTLDGVDLLRQGWHPSACLRSATRLVEQDVVVRDARGDEIEVAVDGGYLRSDDGTLAGAVLLLRPRHHGIRRPRSGVRIVSAVSHELRSPLTSVRGYTSLLLKRWDDIEDEDRRMMLQQVDRDARRIGRMIGELLDISRLEAGRLQLNRMEIDLPSLVEDVVGKVAMSWSDLDVAVRFGDGFPKVWADPDKVEQVVTNLIENACKYASPVGIEIVGAATDAEVEVQVRDRGPGIPLGDVPRLFQQFFRSSEGRPTGTGLGLWISRGLIEAHGGELSATSDVATGSVFRFTLPQRAFDELHPDEGFGTLVARKSSAAGAADGER